MKNKRLQTTLHVVAKTYGCRPSDLMRGGIDDYTIDLICCQEGMREERRQQEKALREAKRGRP